MIFKHNTKIKNIKNPPENVGEFLSLKYVCNSTDANFTVLQEKERDYHCILVIKIGQAKINFNNNNLLLTSGQALLFTSKDFISAKWIGDINVYICAFKGLVAERLISDNIKANTNIVSLKSIFKITETIDSILSNEIDSLDASLMAYSILLELTRNILKQDISSYSKLIKDAMSIINEKYAFLYGVEDIANMLGVTKNHLIRCFTASTGKSPGKFLTERKIKAAKDLLVSGETNTDIIAAASGFSCANYLSKVFKKYTGKTPKQYIENLQTNENFENGYSKYLYL